MDIYTLYCICYNKFAFRNNSFNGSITNISVKEVGQDWTFVSGWIRN